MTKKTKQTVKRLNRRYHLHQRIKRIAKYDAKHRTVYLFTEDEKLLKNKYIVELRDKFQYSIQLQAVNTSIYEFIPTGLNSPSEARVHRAPGKNKFGITFYKAPEETDENLVTKTFANRFTYLGKLSAVSKFETFDTTHLDIVNFDYHVISF